MEASDANCQILGIFYAGCKITLSAVGNVICSEHVGIIAIVFIYRTAFLLKNCKVPTWD